MEYIEMVVTEYPLLRLPDAFGAPYQRPDSRPKPPVFGSSRGYSRAKQQDRLGATFASIEALLGDSTEKIFAAADPLRVAPERVLVMELAGKVQSFANLASKIPGLEYLGEEDTNLELIDPFDEIEEVREDDSDAALIPELLTDVPPEAEGQQ